MNVLVMIELHKRFDPIYIDAKDRICGKLGDFSFFNAYMSQPKHQLHTFKSWAGKSSDISYYLNSHHIDFHEWCCYGKAIPIRVTACCSTGFYFMSVTSYHVMCNHNFLVLYIGVANGSEFNINTEDTITLTVQWKNISNSSLGIALYTSSWVAPKSDVHSQQRFFYMGHNGEIKVDQAHRGYNWSTHETGYQSINPLFMKYTPDAKGNFVGQNGYGYKSISAFIDAVHKIGNHEKTPEDFEGELPTIHDTMYTTAILEAGYRSIQNNCMPVFITYDNGTPPMPIEFKEVKQN